MRKIRANRYRSSDYPTTWRNININFNTDSLADEPCQNWFNTNSLALQDKLTFRSNFASRSIDWSGYRLPNYCDGTLNHIYSNSNYKLNTSEITFNYTGASKRKSYDSESDIVNIFDPTNLNSKFSIQGEVNECFFGLTYNNIQLEPNRYSLAQDQTKGWPASFELDAFDEDRNKWLVLDEQMNVDVRDISSYNTRSFNKSFSSFRIKQTAPGNNGFYGFSLAYFEIYGFVSKRNYNFLNDHEIEVNVSKFLYKNDVINTDSNVI